MNILKALILFVSFLILISCAGSGNAKSKKIAISSMKIKNTKVAFDPASLKINCDSMSFSTTNSKGIIQNLFVNNRHMPVDTIRLASKNLSIDIEKEIIKVDLNFDGFCEFVIPDKKSVKNGETRHYYFVYDTKLQKFEENTSLPAYIGGLKLDIKNQRVKLYCPNDDCFAYYKYTIDKKFVAVQGEYKTGKK